MNTTGVAQVTIDWSRCIHIDDVIDDQYVTGLVQKILSLRQESNDPITVAINSPGGSLSALESLLGLLTGPDQDGQRCEIITVSVRNAYSAAANLLAFGSYAVALPHSEILFHDVRYSGMEDVTPATARMAAARLQNANEQFSLKLANRVFRRLVWNYLDLGPNFENYRKRFRSEYEHFSFAVESCKSDPNASARADIASFATALFAEVSTSSESLIHSAMARLTRWGIMTSVSKALPKYREKGSRKPGLLDATKNLFDGLVHVQKSKIKESLWSKAEGDLQLFSLLLIESISKTESMKDYNFPKILEIVVDDYKLIESINDPSHKNVITKNMLRHSTIFFSDDEEKIVSGEDEQEKKRVIEAARPNAELFWYFCVLLCRELFNGEHALSPRDAQVLGIVDEVAGGGRVQSRRDWRKLQAAKAASAQ